MLEEIRKKVQDKVNQKSSIIILEYFQQLINRHNDFCGCNYCLLLEEYVKLKKYKTHFHRKYYEYEKQDYINIKIEGEFFYNYKTIENKIKNLKKQKDKLKLINKYEVNK